MADLDLTNTYWNGNGRFQELYNRLYKLIPHSGPCAQLPKLERLRKVGNAYYQLFNNGTASPIARLTGVLGSVIVPRRANEWKYSMKERQAELELLEQAVDTVVIAAAQEQGWEVK